MELNFESLREKMAEILDVSIAEVEPSTMLEGNDNWDSFAMLSTVAVVTEQTGHQVTLADISKFKKVSDFVEFIQRLKG